jgi:hypothetical protein
MPPENYELQLWSKKPSKTSGSFKLKHWQCITGWFNWALNIYPLLRPALNNIYTKLEEKTTKNNKSILIMLYEMT